MLNKELEKDIDKIIEVALDGEKTFEESLAILNVSMAVVMYNFAEGNEDIAIDCAKEYHQRLIETIQAFHTSRLWLGVGMDGEN